MAEPNPETVRVAVDRLREDAGKWTGAATGAQGMASAAQGLTLTGEQLGFAAERTGLTPVYQDLQRRVAELCGQAVTTLNGIAGNLTGAADGYEQLEQNSTNNMNETKPPR